MSHALLNSLVEKDGVALLNADEAEAFAEKTNGLGVVFFTGDPEKKLETADVAVVLRELLSQAGPALRAGMIDREYEREAMDRLKVRVLPSLAFVHDGDVLEVIPKIQDWAVYVEKLGALLDRVRAAA